jgi:hypothetical protein
MFGQIAEKTMHRVRWVLTAGWLLLIASLFYDPLSAQFTQAEHPFSPLRIQPDVCVRVQGVCLAEQPYPLGTTVFWAIVVPSAIFILLIFGHELWRRICPLSFLSQIPRALGWQRQIQRVNAKTGKVRLELAKVNADSWLGRNYLYVQLGWLYLGLCARILFINSDRLALALWLLFTIATAIAVGYLYGGKSWCQYFCPMAPVQTIYAEPGGLFASKAHLGDQQITQSMCRTVTVEPGAPPKEQSACVACQNPCIDIDSERVYWNSLTQPRQRLVYYGYVGLVVGYFCYYYLYAGNWDYYFSGAWAHQENQLQTLMNPGFYLFNQPIPIPKILAVPLTLGGFSALGYGLGRSLERYCHTRRYRHPLSPELIQHRIYTVLTFAVFHFFFIFGGRPLILLMPLPVQFLYEAVLVGLSTLWCYHTWNRSPDRYSRESLASRLRRQLERLQVDVATLLEGRSLANLTTDEVYVLAKVLPGFNQAKRHQAYKGVLREALEEGYVNTASSLEVLQQMRTELAISDDEHRQVLDELGVEDPALLDPSRQRSRENLVRVTGYRRALERLVSLQQRQLSSPTTSLDAAPPPARSLEELLQTNSAALQTLRKDYSITVQEELDLLDTLNPDAQVQRRIDFLLNQLADLITRHRALNQPRLHAQAAANLLCHAIVQKKALVVGALLEILEQLQQLPDHAAQAQTLARSLNGLSSSVLQTLLEPGNQASAPQWSRRLSADLLQILRQPGAVPTSCALDLDTGAIAQSLDPLLADANPLLQATSLYLLNHLAPEQGRLQATSLLTLQPKPHGLVLEVAKTIADQPTAQSVELAAFGTLEKLVYLATSDFFRDIHSETLIELAHRAEVKRYSQQQVITEAGDTCRELLLLMAGNVQIQRQQDSGDTITESLLPGYVLDELEVLSHATLTNTIVAQADLTRVLAIPVDTFDDLLDRDHDFARRVLEMESRRLQQVIRAQ